jgi:hypothetical protein
VYCEVQLNNLNAECSAICREKELGEGKGEIHLKVNYLRTSEHQPMRTVHGSLDSTNDVIFNGSFSNLLHWCVLVHIIAVQLCIVLLQCVELNDNTPFG